MRTTYSSVGYSVALILAVTACKSSEADKAPAPAAKPTTEAKKPAEPPPPPATPCEGPEMAELAKQVHLASGFGVDYSDAKAGQAIVDGAIAAIKGKRFAFSNCVFKSQGNDKVSFAPRADSPYEAQIECKMAGGEAGNEAFRNAAMTLDMEKLRLDVVGVVASYQDSHDFTRYTLTECKITPHE